MALTKKPRGRPKKMVVAKPQVKPVENVKITLKSLGRVFKGEGATLEEAINSIKVSNGIKVTSVMLVEKGTYRKERILNGRIAHYLFGNVSPTTKGIYLRKVSEMFGV